MRWSLERGMVVRRTGTGPRVVWIHGLGESSMSFEPAVAAVVPPEVVREGKIPAGWFLEQAGVKGLRRGGMVVADYHANLVYNDGGGTAAELTGLLDEMKRRVAERFGLRIEEEVQYLGFNGGRTGRPASV